VPSIDLPAILANITAFSLSAYDILSPLASVKDILDFVIASISAVFSLRAASKPANTVLFVSSACSKRFSTSANKRSAPVSPVVIWATAALTLASNSACAFSAAAFSAAAFSCFSAMAFAVCSAALLAASANSCSNCFGSISISFLTSPLASVEDSSPLADSLLGANCILKDLNSSAVSNALERLNSVF